jgi:hypothetical protein
MRVADTVTVTPALSIAGALRVPGDKSISHRYALLAAIADGRSTIANYAPGADCASTLSCIEALGAIVSRTPAARENEPALVTIDGRGLRGLRAPGAPLDCGNSGSTMRMLGASSPLIPLYRPLSAMLHCHAARCGASSGRCRKWAPRSRPVPAIGRLSPLQARHSPASISSRKRPVPR